MRADRGRVALMRGPLVYCVEAVDNCGDADPLLAEAADFETQWRDLLGGCVVISGATREGGRFTAVPLYLWDNRLAGAMNVWLRQSEKQEGWSVDGWDKRLYRVWEPRK